MMQPNADVSKMDEATWSKTFAGLVDGISSEVTYEESAQTLRDLVKGGMLKFTDMRDNPKRFFEAHRLLLAPGNRGPGFGIRFTVQFNLFAGSIIGLGNPEQVAALEDYQKNGELGCFCLTETMAGVNSGLVVNTTATWDKQKQKFLLQCPNKEAEKNWISQGLTASRAVVIANLVIDGKPYGPHGFIVRLREGESGKPMPGISMVDMGKKTTGNDLDNARIRFDNVWLEKEALLSKYATIEDDKYVQTTGERMRLEVIGQRLLTGRLAIAQAGIMFGKKLYEKTAEFAQQRQVWTPKGAPPMSLAQLPQLASLFEEANNRLDHLLAYTMAVEERLRKTLIESTIPTAELVEQIAVAKVESIETSIELCHRLKQEVGSYGLMDKTGFEHVDFLQCCKFAEGDSRILGQKMARDTMKKFQAGEVKDKELQACCMKLAEALAASKRHPLEAWNDNWRLVYGVSVGVRDYHVRNLVGPLKQAKL